MRFLLEFFQRLIEGFKIGGRDIGQGIEEAINFGAVFIYQHLWVLFQFQLQ